MLLTCLNPRLMVCLLVSFSLTILQAIKKGQQIHYLLIECLKPHVLTGHIINTGQRCKMLYLPMETLNPFTTLTAILQCHGLRGWRHLFVNVAPSTRMDSMHSALVLNVRKELKAPAVIMFYSHSQTSMPRNLN